ncbi:hypothetical protein Micbo1qcDRAFT_166923 [Microdochium bolleyi]|uniref:Uncharacterized protein n=1 Tax=Microdochium bolleyi TaxID=196109 RepID=A0A136ITZ7_9PEZI|nr:hypothetical protein Micbo1qcDRAFT_166923 [Microdochium bolleyi]
MEIMFLRATYMDEYLISAFLTNLFGRGQCGLEWTRGRWQCIMPRQITTAEKAQLDAAINAAHYSKF